MRDVFGVRRGALDFYQGLQPEYLNQPPGYLKGDTIRDQRCVVAAIPKGTEDVKLPERGAREAGSGALKVLLPRFDSPAKLPANDRVVLLQ